MKAINQTKHQNLIDFIEQLQPLLLKHCDENALAYNDTLEAHKERLKALAHRYDGLRKQLKKVVQDHEQLLTKIKSRELSNHLKVLKNAMAVHDPDQILFRVSIQLLRDG